MLSWLSSLRLSLVQYLLLGLSVAVGGLVVAFKAQGSKLHAAQVQLLMATMRQADSGKEAAVLSARARFQVAMREYQDAKPN